MNLEITGYKDKHEFISDKGIRSVVYLMDCVEGLKQIPENIIDLTITSPPYNLGEKHHTGNHKFKAYNSFSDNLEEDKYQLQQISVLNLILKATTINGSCLYNHKNRIRDGFQISPYEWIFKTDFKIKQEIIWFNGSQNFDKCRFYPMTERWYWLSKQKETQFHNNINQHDIINNSPVGTDSFHKRAFPLGIIEKFIACFEDAKTVLDPYSGSGTTRIVCHKAEKDFVGFELDEDYFRQGNERFMKVARQKTIF